MASSILNLHSIMSEAALMVRLDSVQKAAKYDAESFFRQKHLVFPKSYCSEEFSIA